MFQLSKSAGKYSNIGEFMFIFIHFLFGSHQGGKCLYNLCKKCCRDKCYNENLNCEGHRIRIQLIRQRAQEREQAEKAEEMQPANCVASETVAVSV